MDGFTYNGIHSSTFHCYYIPDKAALFDTKADFEVYDSEPMGQNGGQYFGTRLKPRTFSLSCFFEDITLEMKEKMMHWADRNTYGALVFDERPFITYWVCPTKKLSGKIYQHESAITGQVLYSGTFTITFTAYDPFGYLPGKYYEETDFTGVTQFCGMLEKNEMPPEPDTSSRSILVYNCGTEKCGSIIRIGGTAANGLTIRNETNGNVCKLLRLPPSTTYLEIDSEKGTVKIVDGNTVTEAFEYSDEGYISLEPCGFNYDEIVVSYSSDNNSATVENRVLDASYIGKYIHISGQWFRIQAVSAGGSMLTLSGKPSADGVEKTKLVTMNVLRIEGNGITLNKLEIDYQPKVL